MKFFKKAIWYKKPLKTLILKLVYDKSLHIRFFEKIIIVFFKLHLKLFIFIFFWFFQILYILVPFVFTWNFFQKSVFYLRIIFSRWHFLAIGIIKNWFAFLLFNWGNYIFIITFRLNISLLFYKFSQKTHSFVTIFYEIKF